MLPGRKLKPEDMIKIAWRYRRWWITSLVLCTSVATGFAIYTPNRFRSETVILVVPQRVPEEYVRPTVTSKIEDRLKSLQQQILSRARLERIIEDFNLYSWERGKRPMEDIVEGMRGDITIEMIPRADSFRLAYESHDPQLAMKVTQRLATLFIDENLQDRTAMAENTNQFLESQLEDARGRLEDQEKRLEAFRKKYAGQLPEQMESNLQVMHNAQEQLQALAESTNRDRDRRLLLERQLNDLVNEQERATAALTQKPATPDEDPTKATGLTAAQQLELARTQLRRMELRLKPEHPDLVSAKRLVQELEAKAAQEALQRPLAPAAAPLDAKDNTLAGRINAARTELELVDRQLQQRQAEETRLREVIKSYQARVESFPGLQSELTSLMRDYDTLNGQYKTLLQKREDSKMAANLERRSGGEQFRVLDPARVPERHHSPNRPLIVLIGVFVGLALGGGIAAMREYRDHSFRTYDDVLQVLALPVLASIPVIITTAERLRRRQRRLAYSTTAVSLLFVASLIVWKFLPWQKALERLR